MGLSLREQSWRHLRSLRKIFYDVDLLLKRNEKLEGWGTFNGLCASSYKDLSGSLLYFLLTNSSQAFNRGYFDGCHKIRIYLLEVLLTICERRGAWQRNHH